MNPRFRSTIGHNAIDLAMRRRAAPAGAPGSTSAVRRIDARACWCLGLQLRQRLPSLGDDKPERAAAIRELTGLSVLDGEVFRGHRGYRSTGCFSAFDFNLKWQRSNASL